MNECMVAEPTKYKIHFFYTAADRYTYIYWHSCYYLKNKEVRFFFFLYFSMRIIFSQKNNIHWDCRKIDEKFVETHIPKLLYVLYIYGKVFVAQFLFLVFLPWLFACQFCSIFPSYTFFLHHRILLKQKLNIFLFLRQSKFQHVWLFFFFFLLMDAVDHICVLLIQEIIFILF